MQYFWQLLGGALRPRHAPARRLPLAVSRRRRHHTAGPVRRAALARSPFERSPKAFLQALANPRRPRISFSSHSHHGCGVGMLVHKPGSARTFSASGEHHPDYTRRNKSADFVQQVYLGNHTWREGHSAEFENDLDDMLTSQHPGSTVLTCCDSRIPFSALGFDEAGTVFSVRNIGNQVRNSEGSFRFGIEVLGTPSALVLGHTNCVAIRAAASDYRDLHSFVQREVVSVVRVIRFGESLAKAQELDDLSFDDRCNLYSELNVDFQIAHLLDDWNIRQKVAAAQLTLFGGMFDINNAYGYGHGSVVFTNINGDHDVNSMKNSPVLRKLNTAQRSTCVGRLFSYPHQSRYD